MSFQVQTMSICSRWRIWKNTRIIGTGESCREIPVLNLLLRFWSNLLNIGIGAKSLTVTSGKNCIAWNSWKNIRIIFLHPLCSVRVCGISWLKMKRNNWRNLSFYSAYWWSLFIILSRIYFNWVVNEWKFSFHLSIHSPFSIFVNSQNYLKILKYNEKWPII